MGRDAPCVCSQLLELHQSFSRPRKLYRDFYPSGAHPNPSFGHHRIQTGSCKPDEPLPSHQIPFQPGLHCRAKKVRVFRKTVQQQPSCIINFFTKKEIASLILICRRHARTKKLYHNFAGWIKTLDDLQMLFNHLPLLALRCCFVSQTSPSFVKIINIYKSTYKVTLALAV